MAALCLHALAELETDLDRRARMQRRVVRDLPEVFAYRALAITEASRGRLQAAASAYRQAIDVAAIGRRENLRSLSESLDLVERALRKDDEAVAQVRELRVQTENDLAIIRARTSPKEAMARLKALRARALKTGDRVLGARFLGSLTTLAATIGDTRKQVQLARQLAKEMPRSWTLELLADAERRSNNMSAEREALHRLVALAEAEGDADRRSRAERRLAELSR